MAKSLNKDELERYARQIILKEIGGAGQQDLIAGKVLIIGAGGLGGPAALYLSASGVGHIGIIDEDVVTLSNLQRQIQFTTQNVGKIKTKCLAKKINKINPHVNVYEFRKKINSENAVSIISDYDVVLDGTDNFNSRFIINQACIKTKTKLVSGALGRFDAQLASFDMNKNNACYQCLVPKQPAGIETCAEAGVIGPLAGMIGSMMALETIKILTGAGKPLFGQLFVFDALNMQARIISLPKDKNCPACGNI